MFQLGTNVILLAMAMQQIGTISPSGVQAIGPKQDDPRAVCSAGDSGIIVQGGIEAIGPKQDDPRKLAIGPKQDDPRSPALAIGPKQDDPVHSRTLARAGDENDPKATGGGASGIIVQGGKEAIGPKQDDPRAIALGAYNPETDPAARGSCAATEKKD